MAKVFVGVEAVKSYTAPGERSNPCVAVIFSMLGAGSMQACHLSLVESGISQPDGNTTFPDGGINIVISRYRDLVSVGSPELNFDPSEVFGRSLQAFEAGKALIAAVKLEDSEDPEAMHYILLGGQTQDTDGSKPITEVFVGDSLKDGVQVQTPEEVSARIQETIDAMGAVYTWEVSVGQPAA